MVTRASGKRFTVRSAGSDYECAVRTLLKKRSTDDTPVTVGDDVEFAILEKGHGIIERVAPRRTGFFRNRKGVIGRRQAIAANIDQLVIVVSVADPPLKPTMIDRFIVCAELGGLDPLVVINKLDLGRTELVEELEEGYRKIDIPVFLVATLDLVGIEELKASLKDKRSLFVGHSGVGKSTLLNALLPGLDIKTASVSKIGHKGRHTTTRVELHEFPDGGFMVDSPGLKVLSLWEVTRENLPRYFKEFEGLNQNCRFDDCVHVSEPNCAVKEAVEAGEAPRLRYESYLQIRESLS